MQLVALWDYFKFRIRGLPKPDAAAFDFIRSGMLVFDIGANLGNYSNLFLDKKTKVIAVEPQSYCCDFLQLRFKKNPSITILKCGVGAIEEEKTLMVSSAHSLSSFNSDWVNGVNKTARFKPSNATWDKKEAVKLVTLKSLIEKFGTPDYIKIDVEGFEKEVLKGLHKKIKYLSFEFTIPELVDDALTCIQLLMKLGNYEFHSILENSLKGKWVSANEIEKEITALAESGTLVGGDIFARLVQQS